MIPCLAAELKSTLWQNTFQQRLNDKVIVHRGNLGTISSLEKAQRE